MNKRIDTYDIAKGIGILLVVVGHNMNTTVELRTYLYSFHMPLFFILSGLVMKEKTECGILAEIRRERKLVVNYFVYSLIYITFCFLVEFLILHNIGISGVITSAMEAITLYGISVLWFISTLLLSKVIIYRVGSKIKSCGVRLVVAVVMYSLGVMLAMALPRGDFHGIAKVIYYPVAVFVRLITMSSFLMVGFAVSLKVKEYLKKIDTVLWGGAGFACLLATYWLSLKAGLVDYRVLNFGKIPYAFFAAITGTIGILGLSCAIEKCFLKSVFLFLGYHSLFIMETHEYFMIKNILGMLLYIMPWLSNSWAVVETLGLIGVEVILIKTIEPTLNRVCKNIEQKLRNG